MFLVGGKRIQIKSNQVNQNPTLRSCQMFYIKTDLYNPPRLLWALCRVVMSYRWNKIQFEPDLNVLKSRPVTTEWSNRWIKKLEAKRSIKRYERENSPLQWFHQSHFYLHRSQYSPISQSAPDEQAKGSKGKKMSRFLALWRAFSNLCDQSHRVEHLIMDEKLTDRRRFPKMSIVK